MKLIGLFTPIVSAAPALKPVETTGLTLAEYIANLVSWLFYFGFAIAVGAIIYSGILFITASGNPEKLTKARQALMWSILGMLIVSGAYIIVQLVSNIFN